MLLEDTAADVVLIASIDEDIPAVRLLMAGEEEDSAPEKTSEDAAVNTLVTEEDEAPLLATRVEELAASITDEDRAAGPLVIVGEPAGLLVTDEYCWEILDTAGEDSSMELANGLEEVPKLEAWVELEAPYTVIDPAE
jgi:hypothetical protein